MRSSFVLTLWVAAAAGLDLGGCKFDPGGDGVPSDATADATVDALPPDGDADADGVLNSVDLCPLIPDIDQHDEDADGRGDVCDNCPHVPNADQANTGDGDTVGNACDPDPAGPNHIAAFFGFQSSTFPAEWSPVGPWEVAGGSLRQPNLEIRERIIALSGRAWGNAVVETASYIVAVAPDAAPASSDREVSILHRFTPPGAGRGTGYLCSAFDSSADTSNAMQIAGRFLDTGRVFGGTVTPLPTPIIAATSMTIVAKSTSSTQVCRTLTTAPVEATYLDEANAVGTVALRTVGVAARFQYVIVIAPGVAP